MLRSIGKQSGESVVSVVKKKRRKGFAEKEGLKPGMKEWGGDGWWEHHGSLFSGPDPLCR